MPTPSEAPSGERVETRREGRKARQSPDHEPETGGESRGGTHNPLVAGSSPARPTTPSRPDRAEAALADFRSPSATRCDGGFTRWLTQPVHSVGSPFTQGDSCALICRRTVRVVVARATSGLHRAAPSPRSAPRTAAARCQRLSRPGDRPLGTEFVRGRSRRHRLTQPFASGLCDSGAARTVTRSLTRPLLSLAVHLYFNGEPTCRNL